MAQLTSDNIEEIMEEHMKRNCAPGGMIYAMINDKRDNNHKDGIAGIMKAKGGKIQPDKFENEGKDGMIFRHWAEELKSYLKIVDPNAIMMMNIAEANPDEKASNATIEKYLIDQYGNNGVKDKFFLKYYKDCDMDLDKMKAIVQETKDEEFHTYLMFSLSGVAKEMARNAAPSGIEAWRSLNYRWNRKTQFGATQIAEMIREISQAKTPDDVYSKLNALERLHLELQKNLGEDEVDGKKVKIQ